MSPHPDLGAVRRLTLQALPGGEGTGEGTRLAGVLGWPVGHSV